MRVKLLRRHEAGTVLLAYPATLEEYHQALDTLGRPAHPAAGHAGTDPDREGRGRAHGCYVVTTAEQRCRWGLPDLSAHGRARMVDESRAFDVLGDAAAWSKAAVDVPPDAEAAPSPRDDEPDGADLTAVRAVAAPGPRVDRVLAALECGGLPRFVSETLRKALLESAGSGKEAVEKALGRAALAVALPWRTLGPVRFDPVHLKQELDRTHVGLDGIKTRLVEVLAGNPQTRGMLTVEAPRHRREAKNATSALIVLPRSFQDAARVPCLAGSRGSGKTSLAVAVAEALGRRHVRVTLDKPDTAALIHGKEGAAPGRIIRGLREAGVRNPVFILEGIDHVEDDAADSLLDPVRSAAFGDAYLQAPFDLSAVLWIVTVTDPGAIPEGARKRLEVFELPGYTEHEKLAIAEHLLKHPFDDTVQASAACLAPGPAAPSVAVALDGPAVLVEREASSLDELEALSASPFPDRSAEAWRTAACAGDVRFEPDAVRHVIRCHTNEAGVAELNAKLAALCQLVVARRPYGARGPVVITPAVVREVLGEGAVDVLPPAVREAIARERRRLGDKSDAGTEKTNDWIEWLERLPWTRRSEAAIDLERTRAALDAGHAGLEHAKARIIEYLAVRRRNPLGAGVVICFAGPPGVGKTSLAQCTAEALGRGFVKLACGGLRDGTDLRGHNRTWKDSQPGSILREMRQVGSKDPVFVLDEIDKVGPAPAAVLLEVLDPEQNGRFRDAFIELPFDLSEVLFITTANEPARILPALRDRLEIIDLPGYTEVEKIAIAETHLIGAQNRAAGLTETPVRFTRGACRRIIRRYTSERGIRQLVRCLQTICRKVALGLETGDASLVRERITAAQVRAFLGQPGVDHTDGLDRFREQLGAPALPQVVRARGREVLARLSELAPTDPELARGREYLQCLASLPWTKRTGAASDLARARAVLDAGHVAHGAVKEHVIDYVAVRLTKPDVPPPLLCLVGPPGVGKTWLARLVAAALGRACARVPCGALDSAADLHGARSGPPGRIVEQLRRVGVRNPVFLLDEIDRLEKGAGVAAALFEALDPAPGAGFRDRYVDLPFDLSEALFVATANSLGRVPALLREGMMVVELPGYTEAEKRLIASERLLPMQMTRYGLTADQVRVTDEAVEAIVRGYTREAGVWRLADALGTVCAKVVRRRAEGNEEPVEVTPQALAGMLGAPMVADAEVDARAGRPGVAVGLSWTAAGGNLLFVEASCMSGNGALILTGRLGEVMQESVQVALSWLRANAERYGIDPAFRRDTDVHLHVQSGEVPKEGASAGVTMVAALVSVFTGRVVRGDLAMTGEITLGGQVLAVGAIKEKVLAAHRYGLARVVLPHQNKKQVDEQLGDDLRHAVAVDYVTRVDEVLDVALQCAPAADDAATACTSAGRAP